MTLEQVPAFLLSLREEIGYIKQCLNATPANASPIEKPFDIEGASDFTGLEKPTIYSLAQRGEIPAHKRGKKWYFYGSELNEWIKKGETNADGKKAEDSFLAANKKRRLQGV